MPARRRTLRLRARRPQPWPNDEVHHAREAAWARSVSDRDVLTRLDRAHEHAYDALLEQLP